MSLVTRYNGLGKPVNRQASRGVVSPSQTGWSPMGPVRVIQVKKSTASRVMGQPQKSSSEIHIRHGSYLLCDGIPKLGYEPTSVCWNEWTCCNIRDGWLGVVRAIVKQLLKHMRDALCQF